MGHHPTVHGSVHQHRHGLHGNKKETEERLEHKKQGEHEELPALKPAEPHTLHVPPQGLAGLPNAKEHPGRKHVCAFRTHGKQLDHKFQLGRPAHTLFASEDESQRMLRALADSDRYQLTAPEGLQLVVKSMQPHAVDVKVITLGQLFLEDPYATGTPNRLELRDVHDVAADAAATENLALLLTADDKGTVYADRTYNPARQPAPYEE